MSRLDDAFVQRHESMVRRTAASLARQLGMRGSVDDFVSIGFEALLDARTRFDEKRGVPFEGFAYYRVRGAILYRGPQAEGLNRKTLARVLRAGDAAAQELQEECAQRDDSNEPERVTLGHRTAPSDRRSLTISER